MLNLLYEAEVLRVFDRDTIAGGAADQTTALDMAGWEAITFVVIAGAVGARGLTAVAQQDEFDDPAFADDEDLAGTEIAFANADDDLIGIIDVGKPENRYIRVEMTDGGDDTVVDAVIAIKYRARELPVTQGASVADAILAITPPPV